MWVEGCLGLQRTTETMLRAVESLQTEQDIRLTANLGHRKRGKGDKYLQTVEGNGRLYIAHVSRKSLTFRRGM